jgi:hypothetical protein
MYRVMGERHQHLFQPPEYMVGFITLMENGHLLQASSRRQVYRQERHWDREQAT